MIYQVKYEWNIEDFGDFSETKISKLFSPIFIASPDELSHRWKVGLEWNPNRPENYGIFLTLADEPFQQPISRKFNWKVYNTRNELVSQRTDDLFYKYEDSIGYGYWSAINRFKCHFKNIKRIYCEISLLRDKSVDTKTIFRNSEKSITSEPCNNNLLTLFQNFSDVEIICQYYEQLFQSDEDEPIFVKFNSEGYNKDNVLVSERKNYEFDKYEQNINLGNFEDNIRSKYLSRIYLNIEVIRGKKKNLEPKPIKQNNHQSLETLQEDFLRMFLSAEFSDFTIICEDRQFKVHSQILLSRSSVFKQNLTKDISKTILLKNIDPEVLEVFLKFLYTGSIKISPLKIGELFDLSEKYDIRDLKKVCVLEMEQNPVHYLIVSDIYGMSEIKKRTLKFIKDNLKDIMKTEKWKTEMTNRTHLMEELLTLV